MLSEMNSRNLTLPSCQQLTLTFIKLNCSAQKNTTDLNVEDSLLTLSWTNVKQLEVMMQFKTYQILTFFEGDDLLDTRWDQALLCVSDTPSVTVVEGSW